MDEKAHIKTRRPLRWVAGLLVLIVIALALAALAAWVFRANLAEAYVARYCDQRGLVCEADIEAIDLNRATVSSLKIFSQERETLSTEAINVEYSWPGFLSPKIEKVRVSAPVLHAGFDGTRLDLGGLTKLANQAEGGEPPELMLQDGQIILDTPAGQLSGRVEMSGNLPRSGEATVQVSPAELMAGEDRLSWTTGEISLAISEGRVTGAADFEIEEARLGNLDVLAASFQAAIRGTDDAPIVQWNGAANTLNYNGQSFRALETHGEAVLSEMPDGGFSSALQALVKVTGEVKASAVNLSGIAGEAVTIDAELSKTGETIVGPVALSVSSVSTEAARAHSVSASGDVSLNADDPSRFEFLGSGVFDGVQVEAPQRAAWLSNVQLPGPFDQHGVSLTAALDDALTSFGTGADFSFSRAGDDWKIIASRPTALTSSSGVTVSIEPEAAAEWLLMSNDGVIVSGEIIVSGGGVPTVRASLTSSEVTEGQISVSATKFEIEPWRVNDRTMAIDLAPFVMVSTPERLRIRTKGDVSISGEFPDTQLQPTTLSGGFEASRGTEGWRVQTGAGECLRFATEGMTSGAISLQPVALDICPEDGRFIREESGVPTGKLQLGDVTLPFVTTGASGQLELVSSAIEWRLDDTFRTEITSDNLRLPLVINDRDMVIDGERLFVQLITGDGPVRFSTSLGESEFGGELIPANVSSSGFSFSGRATDTGLEARMRSPDVRIEDYRNDPIYTPLTADLTATIKNEMFELSGPLRLQRSGRVVANAKLEMGLVDLNGTAKLTSRELKFEQGGLQPHDLSDLLRAILPNARGTMKGTADFQITGGQLSGTGDLAFNELGFDTFRLGVIDGVSGTVSFSDIIGLTTLPDQIVSVETIDPGVPLKDGRIAFQMIEGRVLQLQGARWPFAGGELTVEPTRWELGGETELVTVNARDIELAELITAFSLEKEFRAEGTVSGTFPLEIDGPNAIVRNAILKADESGGKLAYVGKSLDALKGRSDVTDYAVDALEDFQFKVLEVGANGNVSGNIALSIGLEGNNPDVLDGTDFRFNIVVDSKLAQLLRSAQSATTGSFITSIISEQVAANRERAAQE